MSTDNKKPIGSDILPVASCPRIGDPAGNYVASNSVEGSCERCWAAVWVGPLLASAGWPVVCNKCERKV